MTIYYLAYGILIFLYCAAKIRCSDATKKALSIAFFVIFTIMLGCRHPSMGRDLGYGQDYGYLSSFEQLSRLDWKKVLNIKNFLNYERGYVIYNKAISVLSKNGQFLLFATSLISTGLIAATFFKLSDNGNILMTIIVYVALPSFLIQFSGLRQTIAIAICVFSLRFIEARKFVPFIGLIIGASLFHTSALCFAFAYFIYAMPINRKWRVGTMGLLALIYIFRVPLFQILTRLIRRTDVPDYNGAVTLFIAFVLVYLFCCMFENDDTRINGYMNLFFIACVCQSFSSVYSSAMRMGYYYMISLPFLLPLITHNIKDYKQREIVRFVVYCGFLVFGLNVLSSRTGWAMTNPYSFFWQ